MKKRIFSGVQPTGTLHIGNYLGAIKNWLELQDKYESIFCIVDLHALTTLRNPTLLRKKTLELATIYLAAGLNPKKCIIFIQSQVPEHTELTWLLNTITKIPELERMTQFKEKAKQHRSQINAGLLNYPVLMTADILLYHTHLVPVGEDQKQHVEITRVLAKRFNRLYGKTFTIPQPLIKKEGGKIKALDNPSKKMSKTAPHPSNYLALTDSPAQIKEKIKRAVTDSGQEIKYDPKNKAGISNLMTIYSLFSGFSFKEIEQKYQGKGYAQFKEDLANVVINALRPFQEKKKALDRKPSYVRKILDDGAKKARAIAQKTMLQVRKKMGLI